MSDLIWERIIAIFGMSLWLAFPIGIFIAVIKQDRMAHRTSLYPHIAGSPFNYYALHTAAEDEDQQPQQNEDRDSSESEDENGLLHYLKGREKLHEGDNLNKPGE